MVKNSSKTKKEARYCEVCRRRCNLSNSIDCTIKVLDRVICFIICIDCATKIRGYALEIQESLVG